MRCPRNRVNFNGELHERRQDGPSSVANRVRLGVGGEPYVRCMPAVHIAWDSKRSNSDLARSFSASAQPEFWLKAEMLESALGRSLLLLCGSSIGQSLYTAATGFRRTNYTWWDFDTANGRKTLPSLPLSGMWGRLQAAQLAAVYWEALDHAMPVPPDLSRWLRVLEATPVIRRRHPRPGETLGLMQWAAALSHRVSTNPSM
jgi:hypothetical protein